MEESTQKNENQSGLNETDEHLNEHNYDGIQELDNPPPRWIMAIFYLTIGFSIIYAAYYFWLDVGDPQDAEYVRKSEFHDIKYKVESESTDDMGLLSDAADIEEGKTIFKEMNCFTCQGVNLEGNAIGPNLTDNASINGCDFQEIFNVIKNGVPAKGMTPFKAQLSDNRIQKVTSYIISLKGSNPENAKEPQGETCE
jgi:cytochrome c oxidase cbb3-type subunit 3